jgi:hypothetical protein
MLFANIIPITSPTFKERRLKFKIKIFRKKLKKILIKRLVKKKMQIINKYITKDITLKSRVIKLNQRKKLKNIVKTVFKKLKCSSEFRLRKAILNKLKKTFF